VSVFRAAVAALAACLLAGEAPAEGVAGCRQISVVPIRCVSGIWQGARCTAIPFARQPCFTLRGRLALYNGTPGWRLLPLGGRRILGVVDGKGDAEGDTVTPAAVTALARPPSPGDYLDTYGDFRVCPLSPDEPGWMRMVCIDSVRDLQLSIWQNNQPGGRLQPSSRGKP
jgi:hypothetical protein